MSDMVFYLKLEPYLHQWLTHSLGNPVAFPVGSAENALIRRFLRKLPSGCTPDLPDASMTAVVIPDSKAKPPHRYNYLGHSAKSAIRSVIEDLFRMNLWLEMQDMTNTCGGVNKKILAWCELHGIDDDYSEAVRQKYYRMRRAYDEKGIFLGKFPKK